MKIRQLLKHIKLGFIERRLKILMDIRRLNSIKSTSCNSANLRILDNSSVNSIFNNDKNNQEWLYVKDKISAFDIPDGTGGVNPGDRRAIFHLVRELKPSSVLEIGTHIGASTIHIAAALRLNSIDNPDEKPTLDSIDINDVNDVNIKPWMNAGMNYSPAEMLNSLNCLEFVNFKNTSSIEFFNHNTQKFDFIFLDGSHSAHIVYQELPIALSHLNHNGIILLHDYFPDLRPLWADGNIIPGPWLAIERLKKEGNNLSALPLGALPWTTKLKSNITSLALLTKRIQI